MSARRRSDETARGRWSIATGKTKSQSLGHAVRNARGKLDETLAESAEQAAREKSAKLQLGQLERDADTSVCGKAPGDETGTGTETVRNVAGNCVLNCVLGRAEFRRFSDVRKHQQDGTP